MPIMVLEMEDRHMGTRKDGSRLLVVDDEFEVIQSVSRALRQVPQLSISSAASAGDALQVLDTTSIDAVLVDWKLPDTSGDELLRRIRENYPDMPAGLVSGHLEAESAAELMREGLAGGFLPKPFSNGELLRAVEGLVGAEVVASPESTVEDDEDTNRTLRSILRISMSAAYADAGIIYGVRRRDDGSRVLYPSAAENTSRTGRFSGAELEPDGESVVGFVAFHGVGVNIPDAYDISPEKPYRFDDSFDRALGYRTKSMLVLPVLSPEGSVVGVLQLINRKGDHVRLSSEEDVDRYVTPFDGSALSVVRGIVHMAALAVDTTRRIQGLKRHIDSFTLGVVDLIEKRDPPTAGHSARVATLAERIAARINETSRGPLAYEFFPPERLRALRTAAIIHDVGKLFVDERILKKRHRLLDDEQSQVVPDVISAGLTTDDGTLTPAERALLQAHVRYSAAFAEQVDWPPSIRNVARICAEHHERLDGSGYPEGIAGAENLLLDSRILAVVDVFEALTATDRPYRKSMSEIEALDELRGEAAAGTLDRGVVEILATLVLGGQTPERSA